ncbi:MAG: hypothetical protein AAGI52_00805 [Bacteroidota bacterium]
MRSDARGSLAPPASVPRRALLAVLCLVVAGCNREEPYVPPDPPTEPQLRADLDSLRFAFLEDADGPRYWRIEPGEIRRLDLTDQTLNDSGTVARSRLSLVLRAENRAIQGDLVLRHEWRDSLWVLDAAGRAGPNWRASDAAATLFAVRVLPDSTLRRLTLALDPIVRYERGEYLDPLASARREARALFDSTFVSDSLRDATEAGLARRTADALAPRQSSVFLLGPGQAPARARVDSTKSSLVGCEYVTAFAAPEDLSAAQWVELATTSSVMGAPEVPGGSIPRALVQALETVARQRLDVIGLSGSRLRLTDSRAADLDGDGRDEAVGVFAVGDDASPSGLALAVEVAGGQPRLLAERLTTRTDGFRSFDLLGVVDIDSDGAAEALFVEEGAEAYRYLIITHRAGRFTEAFRGGGSSC